MSFFDFVDEKTEIDGYMKIKDGENRFRILSKSVSYFEDWLDKKPYRYTADEKPDKPFDEKLPIKQVASFIVWNCLEKKIQILSLKQVSIRKKITTLVDDEEWGLPYFYDLKVIRSGKDMLTRYDVNPCPKSPTSPEIIQAFKDKPINLDALYPCKDPFATGQSYTEGIFYDWQVKNEKKTESNKVTEEQVKELREVLKGCNPLYMQEITERLKNPPISAKSFLDLTPQTFANVLAQAKLKKIDHDKFLEDEKKADENSIGF